MGNRTAGLKSLLFLLTTQEYKHIWKLPGLFWQVKIPLASRKYVGAPTETEQVKPGFTNYLPRGLAQKIEYF